MFDALQYQRVMCMEREWVSYSTWDEGLPIFSLSGNASLECKQLSNAEQEEVKGDKSHLKLQQIRPL